MAEAASTYLGEQRRRGTRINQTLPVVVRGMDLLGQPFEERTAAQTLSLHGCRYASKHHLPKNTWITIEAPSGHKQKKPLCVRARVAWIQRPRTLRELFQVGVELETGSNIWGVVFPPENWSGGMDSVSTGKHSSGGVTAANTNAAESAGDERSLESYLEAALVHSGTGLSADNARSSLAFSVEDNPLLHELRYQFKSQAQKVLEEARMVAEQLVQERAAEMHNELHNALNNEQRATAEAFYEKWRQEFEAGKADTKEEISSELAQDVAAQIARVQQEVHESLNAARGDQLDRAQAALSDWERRTETLRQETREIARAAVTETEQRLDEKLARKLNELRKELVSSAATDAPAGQPAVNKTSEATPEDARGRLQEEIDAACKGWSELVESSLDNAAQRLARRVADGSQQLLRAAEQKLAMRVAELQEESGLSAEAARAALDEAKIGLDQEVAQAKAALGEIERSATHFSEYSRQLEAASQDSVNELRQRLESSVALQAAEMDRRAAELQKQFLERSGSQLEDMSRRMVAHASEEATAAIGPSLERAAEAARQLSSREQQAEETFHIHRERLRQISEQAQRETAAHLSSTTAAAQREFEIAREEARTTWIAELNAGGARAAEEAAAALAQDCESQLHEAGARIDLRAEETIGRAQARMDEAAVGATEKARIELEGIEAAHLAGTHERLGAAADERLGLAKNQFAQAAEAAAATFRQVIEGAARDSVKELIAESNAQAEQGRARLLVAAEQVLQSVQSHVQNSFDHFQEQLAMKVERSLIESSENLASRAATTLEALGEQSNAHLAEWSAKQNTLGAEAFARHEDRLRSAGDCWLEATARQLDAANQSRMESLIRAAEEAMRKTCVDVFDGVAHAMKEKLLGAPAEPGASSPSVINEDNSRPRRASA